MGRGLPWIHGFNKHLLGTSCVLGTGGAEMKDNGEVVQRLCKVGQLEDAGWGEAQVSGSPLQLRR